MGQSNWQTAVRALAGFALGFALWWGFSPSYATLLAKTGGPILRLSEKPGVTLLRSEGMHIIVNRADFPRSSARPGIPAHDLTFNVILLTTLFAANSRPFSNRNVSGFVIALVLLFVTHVAGVVATVKSIYALQLGEWSRVHYDAFWRNLWGGAAHFYRLVGIYAFAFAIWWLCSADSDASPKSRSAGPKKRRVKRRG